MKDKALTYEAGCNEALAFLRSIAGKMQGSAYHRMTLFREMTGPGGEIDRLCDRLTRIIAANQTHDGVLYPRGSILALGHLDVAKQHLHDAVKVSEDPSYALNESSDKAVIHLEQAIEAIKR